MSLCELQVLRVEKGVVTCRAQNDALLDGLLTVIHSDKSSEAMSSAQVSDRFLFLACQHKRC